MEWRTINFVKSKVCGITPITPGFKVIRVAPQMGDLTNASATIETIAGKVQVVLKRKRIKFICLYAYQMV